MQLFARVLVVLGPEERVDRLHRVLRDGVFRVGSGGGGSVRPEPSVHRRAKLDHALRHDVARAVLEFLGSDERAHGRPWGWRVAHHSAHGRHALAAGLAHGLVEFVRRHVVAHHVARQLFVSPTAAAAEFCDDLVRGSLPPDSLESIRVHQLGQRAGKHLRPTHKPRVFSMCACCLHTTAVVLNRGQMKGIIPP